LHDEENLPTWVIEKIAQVKGMIVSVMDYMISSHEQQDGDRLDRGPAVSMSEGSEKRCPQCGMTNCTCALGKCKCKPIAGWIPNKGFKKQGIAEGVSDLSYDAQSLITKLRRDVEEKRLQPTPQAVLAAARELAGDMDFAPQLLVKQVLGQGVAEGSNPEKVEVRFSAKEYAAMSPAQKAAKQEEWQQLKQQAKMRLQNFTLIDTDKEQGVAEGKRNLKCVCKTHGTLQCPVHTPKDIDVLEGAKVDRMVKHVAQSEKKLGHSKKESENIAWATANKRGMLDNKNKKK
jgi:hypothetical protein